jgi:ABC-type nitrate/sulfonate/bicarbonate transport system ATPase subunit
VTELVGWEHSMKNELILAKYTGQKKRSARERLLALLAQFGLEALAQTRYPIHLH